MNDRLTQVILRETNRMLADWAYDREDIIQHVFLSILIAEKIHGKGFFANNPLGLRQKIQWAIKDYMRKNKRKEVIGVLDEDVMDNSTEYEIINKIQVNQLKNRLQDLGEKYVKAIEMYYMEGKKLTHIAKELNISVATTWRIIKRGINALQKTMNSYLYVY